MTRMLLFLLVVSVVLSLMYLYLSRRLIVAGGFEALLSRRLHLVLLAFVLVQMIAPILGRFMQDTVEPFWFKALSWLSYLDMGLMAVLFFLVLGRDALLLVGWGFDKGLSLFLSTTPYLDAARLRFLVTNSNMVVIIGAILLTAAGFISALAPPKVERVTVSLPGLPTEMEGFRIAQLSDLHLGATLGQEFLSTVVERTMALSPDVVAITGDVADGLTFAMREKLAPFQRLRAPSGVFAVTGNHEYYWGHVAWVEELRSLGFSVLINEGRMIEKNGGRLWLAGVTDFEGGHFDPSHESDPKKAAEGSEGASVKILLAHQGRSAFEAEKAGFDLLLVGHTHGGQFVPWNYLVRLQQPFVSGMEKLGKLWVYTSRGTGYWGPPLRLGVPSEITLFTLTGE